ncbi:inner membrane protein [Clostridium cavendishii DSM 21758]|uniref:Inner membrane protein n=1 Tax=Clostridium cavendishii DSM 21758 TaxID=1121302 RepID=A0A1M6EZ49_9CLOT|nr:metal-dependent hydrolase [Clostridium cavendishii]SHI90671.1 inner membrane protein [Clostridium cavendishii DSM 21758]
MDYKTHRIGGICSGIIFSSVQISTVNTSDKIVYSGAIILGAAIGSLIPDLDHPKSVVGKRFKPVSKGINKAFGHRGITHSPIALIFYTLLMLRLTSTYNQYYEIVLHYIAIGSAIGYLSHLFLDMLTLGGIPLFYPLSKKHFNLARFKTDRDYYIVSFLCIAGTILTLTYLK